MSPHPQRRFAFWHSTVALVAFLFFQAALWPGALAARCVGSDPSATFSSQLSLPLAPAPPWAGARDAIVHEDYKEAENILQTAPSSASRWLWEGVLLLHERRTFASIQSLEQAAHLRDNSEVETLLAVDYFLLNQRLLADDALIRALQFDPNDAMAFYLRGRLAFVSDGFDKARQNFAATLAQEPNDYHSLYYLGFSEWRMGLNSGARKDLQRAVDVLNCHHLSFSLAPYTLSQIEFNAGDVAAALNHSDLALKMSESAPLKNRDAEEIARILTLRGKIENHIGHSKEAEQDFERVVKLNPYLAEGWYLLARLYREEGKHAQAATALKNFQQLQSEL